jgi:cytosine/adenosine deaminase-related metal-dependent hydrolase
MQAAMTAEEEHDTTLLGLVELLKGGTTCFVDPGSTQYLETVLPAYEAAGCRVMTGEQVTDLENAMNLPVYDTPTAVQHVRDSIERSDGLLDGRVRAWAMPFSQAVCSPSLLRECDAIAEQLGTMITLHHFGGLRAGGAPASVDDLPTGQLRALGVLSPRLVLSHGMNLADAEISHISASGAHVVMCPSTVLKGGGSIRDGGRLPELLEAGVDVALGTDSVNSSNYLDMVRAMNAAAVVYKDARRDPAQITAETALELATIRGARALGIDALVGSIEIGKRADLVLFDTRRAEWRALTNPVRNLVYSASADSVHTVLVDGRVVVEGGVATFADEWDLIQKVESHGERIRASTGIGWDTDWPLE